MLKILKGNLFEYAVPRCIIAHGCNAQGKMKSGFAKQLRRIYPRAYLQYRLAYIEGNLKVGDWILVNCRGVEVFNAITQEYYGRNKDVVYVDYSAVESTLKHIAKHALKEDLPIHMPFIGGGLANGNRDQLMSIFESVFKQNNAMLYLLDE